MTNKGAKQFEVTVLAVHVLGGGGRSIDTEDIAVKCHEMAPDMFSWQKYKDQINLELVRVSLSDAKKIRNGELISGSGREGWRLTSKGVDWINRAGNKLLRAGQVNFDASRRNAGSVDTVRRNRERERLLQTRAWGEWVESKYVSTEGAQELFRVDGYTTSKMLQIKIARLRTLLGDDPQVDAFLDTAGKVVMEDIQK